MSAAISVKGTRQGVLITLGAGEMADITAELIDLIDSRKAFFTGGKVALQVGERKLGPDHVTHLRELLRERDVIVWAILSTDPITCATVERLGLETRLATPPPPPAVASTPPPAVEREDEDEMGILVDRTLRSGQSVHCVGHVVVLGDVNPGAEVMAGGDVVVWGRLRGIVHAGAFGDAGRCVCALDLSPTQLRIGSHIARPPEERRRAKQVGPERAFVSKGRIVAERWR
jgi:septum site-determining protein MinC